MTGQTGGPTLQDDCYDVISMIYHKAKAIATYEKYLQDVQQDNQLRHLLLQIRHDDQRHLEQLKNHLARLLAQKPSTIEDSKADVSFPGD